MGEVYRAHDTKLGRDVAIKILPGAFTADPDRLSRFEREARVLAALNHPHIAAIYGIEETAGVRGIVLELVDGETLAHRLHRQGGAGLPVVDALAVARQIADALDAAHERNIVHRDLKPANIALTRDGVVKVLDFGIAKTVDREALDPGPTSTSQQTGHGVILGTAAYMSPEQARGLAIDKRTDIWAFGCVLFELLSGAAPFSGATMTDTLAAVLEREPNWRALPPATPASVARLLRRCLQRDLKSRLRDIGDVRSDLAADDPGDAGPAHTQSARWTRRSSLVVSAVLLAVVAASVWIGTLVRPRSSPPVPPHGPIRFTVMPPEGTTFSGDAERTFLALSPDGTQLAFVARSEGGAARIWLRPISAVDARPVPGTDGANSLFWSPDGGSVGFFAGNKLKRINLSNLAAFVICDVPENIGLYGTWGINNEILFASVEGDAIYSVPTTASGTKVAVVERDLSRGESRVHWPWFLPDGKRFFYLARLKDGSGHLMLGERGRPSRTIMPLVSAVQWVDPDYLVYAREGTLVGQRFDLRTERAIGEPFGIADAVGYQFSTGRTMYTTSRTGTVAYQQRRSQPAARLVWVDRGGRELGPVAPLGMYQNVRLSPDGGTILFQRIQPELGTFDIWTWDAARGTETRLTSDPGSEAMAVWLRDGRSIAFMADRGGSPHLFRKDLVTGAEEELLPEGRLQQPLDASPDGKSLLYAERTLRGNYDILMLPFTKPATPTPIAQSRFDESYARISPDGRAIALHSNESGQYALYVAGIPVAGTKEPVPSGGTLIRWAFAGAELLYLTADGRLFSMTVKTEPSLELGPPRVLFQLKPGTTWADFDVSSDGTRFLGAVAEGLVRQQPVTLVLNALAEHAK